MKKRLNLFKRQIRSFSDWQDSNDLGPYENETIRKTRDHYENPIEELDEENYGNKETRYEYEYSKN